MEKGVWRGQGIWLDRWRRAYSISSTRVGVTDFLEAVTGDMIRAFGR